MQLRAGTWVLLLALTGCPRSDSSTTTTVQDAATPTSSASVVAPSASGASNSGVLAPLDTLGGGGAAPVPTNNAGTGEAVPPALRATASALAAAAGSGKPVSTGAATATATATATHAPSGNQLQACCSALRKQAQQQPAQAAQYQQAATLCDGFVAAAANAGGAPQLEQLKPLLQGAQLPPLCQF